MDKNCDGTTDGSDALDATTWYADADGDPDVPLLACFEGDGASATADDCDDSSATVHPGMAESCDGVDADCDGEDFDAVNVPGDFPTIQQAVDAAADGDTVCVAPGTWTGQVSLEGRALTLVGGGGSAATILDGDGIGPVLAIDSPPTGSPCRASPSPAGRRTRARRCGSTSRPS